MVIYNVTISIDETVEKEWVTWMIQIHIPDVLKTGLFLEGKISKLLVENEMGISYSIQYTAPSMEHLEVYQQQFAAGLQKEHQDKFEGKFAAFRSVMEVIAHYAPGKE